MSTMVERVAMRLYAESEGLEAISEWPLGENGKNREFWRHYARAAIEAMREPNEAMLNAGSMRTGEAYTAMIDAALNEQSVI